MKHLDDYRDAEAVRRLADAIGSEVTQPWTIMEVCGGQTHSIIRFGLDTLLPDDVTLVHGPGCPVCVTPVDLIDTAIAIAGKPEVILCSFGDMLRVPGTAEDLFRAKSSGADVRVVYSPMDALQLAVENPDREVVFFAVGFETTAPANAMAVHQAKARSIKNFSILCSHVLVPPAMEAVLEAPDSRVQGFLAAGHVCAVMGWEEYRPVAKSHHVPIVVTGFEPVDILQGILLCVQQLQSGRAEVENQYARWVSREGNEGARDLIQTVFQVIPREWRGIGSIPASGFGLSDAYAEFDAALRFPVGNSHCDASVPDKGCISGLVLQGSKKPAECPHFGQRCTPEHPLGATMVSDEGACAAYYRYRKTEQQPSGLQK